MSKKILVADDSVTIQRVVELTFAEEGYDVTCLGEASKVMGTARRIHPDLVLLDVSLPEESGYDVCRRIKQDPELRHVPVMLLTGTFEPFDRDRARRAGAAGHLTKPFESQVLISRVSELIDRPPPVLPEPVAPEVVAAGARSARGEAGAAAPPVIAEAAPAAAPGEVAPEVLDAIARQVVERLSEAVVREVAWEVVPELAERLVQQRIRQIEEEAGL